MYIDYMWLGYIYVDVVLLYRFLFVCLKVLLFRFNEYVYLSFMGKMKKIIKLKELDEIVN